MSKKYLIEHSSCEYSSNGMEFKVKDAKEVEVLDASAIDQIGFNYDADSSLMLSEILAANNLQIIKTVK